MIYRMAGIARKCSTMLSKKAARSRFRVLSTTIKNKSSEWARKSLIIQFLAIFACIPAAIVVGYVWLKRAQILPEFIPICRVIFEPVTAHFCR